MKSKSMWKKADLEVRNEYGMLIGTFEEKRPLLRPRSR
jgi:hypothetical protein